MLHRQVEQIPPLQPSSSGNVALLPSGSQMMQGPMVGLLMVLNSLSMVFNGFLIALTIPLRN